MSPAHGRGALMLLAWLRLRGGVRQRLRRFDRVRSALPAAAGILLFLIWIGNFVMMSTRNPGARTAVASDAARLYGPFALLGFALFPAILNRGAQVLAFRPAEVDFLFPGPFSRRQLLIYKIGVQLAWLVPLCFFLGISARQIAPTYLHGVAGVFVTMSFGSLLSIAIALIRGSQGSSAGRAAAMGVAAWSLLIVIPTARYLLDAGTSAALAPALRAIADSPTGSLALAPLTMLVGVLIESGPAWLVSLGVSIAINLALIVLILRLDRGAMETLVAASEKYGAKLEAKTQRKRPEASAILPRVDLPVPRFAGGLMLWKQTLQTIRTAGVSALVLVVVAAVGGSVLAWHSPKVFLALVAPISVMGMLMLPSALRIDFRADLEVLEWLKTLPVKPWKIALGQMLAPTIVVGAIMLSLVAIAASVTPALRGPLSASLLIALPVVYLLVCVDNLFFLLYPTASQPAGPLDFQAMGRTMILFVSRVMILGIALGIAGALAFGVSLLLGKTVAVLATFPVLLVECAVMTLLVGNRFEKLDPSRDMLA